jgi:cold shock CspA family protein
VTPRLLNYGAKMNELKVIGRIIKVSKTGWGFISSRDIQFTRIFFHWTALRQDTLKFPELKTGMHVEFTPLEIPGKGYRAVHVRVIEKAAANEEATTDVSTLPELGQESA